MLFVLRWASLIALLLLCVSAFWQQTVEATSDHSKGDGDGDSLTRIKRIVIDPGHGGSNLGARGKTGLYEKYSTLEIAYRLKDHIELQYPDVEVYLTRETDREMGLRERIAFANAVGADLFISIHLNAAERLGANGIETFFLQPDQLAPEPIDWSIDRLVPTVFSNCSRRVAHRGSVLLAEIVQGELIDATDAFDRGVKQGRFTVLREARFPAIVVELGFVSNQHENLQLLDPTYQQKCVDALISSIKKYDTKLHTRL